MTNATKIFNESVAIVRKSIGAGGFKWAAVENPESMVNAVAYEAIADALIDTELSSREQRAIRNEVALMAGCELSDICAPLYLMKNEIAEINNVVLSNI